MSARKTKARRIGSNDRPAGQMGWNVGANPGSAYISRWWEKPDKRKGKTRRSRSLCHRAKDGQQSNRDGLGI